jgi:hypothetical protein
MMTMFWELHLFPSSGYGKETPTLLGLLETANFSHIFVYTAMINICEVFVFENRVLRRIFGPKRDEVTGEWRKLHNEELRDLYSSPSIIRIIKSWTMRWVGHVTRMREKRNAYRLLVGKSEGKRPLGRPRRRWVDNIRMERWDGEMWTALIWLRIGTGGQLL